MPSAASSSASKRAPITEAAFNVRLARGAQSVDARLDGGLHRGRHAEPRRHPHDRYSYRGSPVSAPR